MKRLKLGALNVGGLALVVASLLADAPAMAGSGEEQVPVGPRPLALGGAYTAIAEGPDAIYWNPAGLGFLRVSHLRATHADLHGLGIQDNVISLTSPFGDHVGIGLEWYHSGFDDVDLEDGLNRIVAAGAWRLNRRVAVGFGLKYMQQSQKFSGIDQGTGTGIGLDLGVLARPTRDISLGLAYRDVGGTKVRYDDATSTRPYDPMLVFGAAVEPWPFLRVAADVGRDVHLGSELQLVPALALRAGWRKDLDGLDDGRFSAGFGLNYGPARAEYAFRAHPALDATHHFGVGLDFTLSPKLVDINELNIQPALFTSFYKTYAKEPVGELIVTNTDDKPVEIQVTISQDELMDGPSQQTLYLAPGVAGRVEMPVVLAPKALSLREGRPMTFDVELSYLSAGRRRREKRRVQTFVYEPGKLAWGESVDKAAAFITPTHQAVQRFTRDILLATGDEAPKLLGSRSAARAAKLFNGLAATGFQYTPDPLNPYENVQGEALSVDTIKYPAELLAQRTGDCDDTTVLYASMLENVGIPTALVDVPGHIYVMFNSGLTGRDLDLMSLDPGLFIQRDDVLWIPVETTMVGKPFHEAWQKGAELYQRYAASDAFQAVETLQARQRYEAAVYGGTADGDEIEYALSGSSILELVDQDQKQIKGWMRNYLIAQLEQEEVGNDPDTAVQLARGAYLTEDFTTAEAELQKVPEEDRDATLWNNLGVVQIALQQPQAAAASLAQARALDPTDAGVALNRGLALLMMGEAERGKHELAYAGHTAGGLDKAMSLIGVKPKPEAGPGRAAEATDSFDLDVATIEDLLAEALEAIPSNTKGDSLLTDEAAAYADSLALSVVDSLKTTTPSDSSLAAEGDTTMGEALEGETGKTVPLGSRGSMIRPQSLPSLLYWKAHSRGESS